MRKEIAPKRRDDASALILKSVLQKPKGWVLSYWPIGNELDIRPLNLILAAEKRLLLPAIQGDALAAYRVDHPEEALKLSHMRIWEPDPSLSTKIEPEQIDLVLVPGLAFDRQNYRLGYGEGWYDRFLGSHRRLYSIGIGYLEQLYTDLLPKDVWDIPLNELLLG